MMCPECESEDINVEFNGSAELKRTEEARGYTKVVVGEIYHDAMEFFCNDCNYVWNFDHKDYQVI